MCVEGGRAEQLRKFCKPPLRQRPHTSVTGEGRATARQVVGQRRAAPLVIGILRRERDRAIAVPPGPVARPAERQLAGGWREHADQQLEQCCLAGAIRPGKTISVAALEAETDVLQDLPAARIAESEIA